MFLASKVLPLFVLPFGISLLLLIVGLVRRRRAPVIAGLGLLLLASNPGVSKFLVRWTEAWAERRPVAMVATADAIVVLSEGRLVAPGPEHVSEWVDGDRFHAGVLLARAHRAPWLVFTGAWIDWEPSAPREGDVLKAEAERLGVPSGMIRVTPTVANTADEAREVRTLLRAGGRDAPKVILVTSAFHMPRARQIFEQAGIAVEPFPVDFAYSAERRWTILDLLPSTSALSGTQGALREQYGRAYYAALRWWRGHPSPALR